MVKDQNQADLSGSIKIKNMKNKKWELLKKAYDNYPKGTKFWWPHDAVKNKVTSSGVFEINNSKWIFDKNDRSKAVFNGDNWAEIIAEETRIPLLVSEDGVDLYEGNYYHRAYKSPSCANWNYNGFWKRLEADCYGIQKPEEFKIFSTKQAALKWIEEQNKPKEIIHSVGGVKLTMNKEYIIFETEEKSKVTLDAVELFKDYKLLQNG